MSSTYIGPPFLCQATYKYKAKVNWQGVHRVKNIKMKVYG